MTYLTALELRANQQVVSSSLQKYKSVIEDRNKPFEYTPNVIKYTDRSSIKETVADIWNSEIIKGVNWLYSINWLAAGEKFEKGIKKVSESSGNVAENISNSSSSNNGGASK